MSKLKSIFSNTCPRCQTGKVFANNKFFHPKKFHEMHTHCSHCNLKYEKEVGFFYGAMYVSYGLTAGWVIASFVINELFFDLSAITLICLAAMPILFLAPVTFRASRLIWLNLFIKFDKDLSKEKVAENSAA